MHVVQRTHARDAGLHGRSRKHRLNRFWKALESVHARDQHVLNATVLKFGQHAEPEFCALGFLEPQSQHIFVALAVDADGDVHGLVDDGAVFSDFHENTIEHQNRVDPLERARLPATQARQVPLWGSRRV